MFYDRLLQVYIGLIRDSQLNWRGEAEPRTVLEHEVDGQQGAQDETKKPHLYSRHEADAPRRCRVLDPQLVVPQQAVEERSDTPENSAALEAEQRRRTARPTRRFASVQLPWRGLSNSRT